MVIYLKKKSQQIFLKRQRRMKTLRFTNYLNLLLGTKIDTPDIKINILQMRNKSHKISISGHSSFIYKKERGATFLIIYLKKKQKTNTFFLNDEETTTTYETTPQINMFFKLALYQQSQLAFGNKN